MYIGYSVYRTYNNSISETLVTSSTMDDVMFIPFGILYVDLDNCPIKRYDYDSSMEYIHDIGGELYISI